MEKSSKVNVFGVEIDNVDMDTALAKVEDFIDSNRANFIATPNPEILLTAKIDFEYKKILNEADLLIPDGFGLQLFTKITNRVTGADFARKLLELAEEKKHKVVCILREDGLSSKNELEKAVGAMFPRLDFVVMLIRLSADVDRADVNRLLQFSPQIILCGFGFPEQEEWLSGVLPRVDTVRVGIGIGGTFDYWTKQAVRAPKIMSRLGIEWVWRLLLNPRRLGRIFRAVVVFPIKIFLNK